MKSLNEDLKTGNFKNIYLLHGEERFLKKRYKTRLSQGVISESDTMNYNCFEGDKINTKEIIDLAETMPFFADRRLIVIENSNLFKNANAEFAEYLTELPETTHIIFVEDEIDKRGKLYKTVQAKGRVVEFSTQDTKTLSLWLAGIFKADGKQIKEKSAQYLIEKVGDDMFKLQGEANKLIAYTLGRNIITEDDIDAICVSQITNQIFSMVDAVAARNQKQALEYYYDLLTLKEPAMRILFMLTRHFRILYQIKAMDSIGMSQAEIGKKAGVPPFAVKKYQAQAKCFKGKELRTILEDAASTEEKVKTGMMADKLAVELFIVKYSMT